MKKFKFMLIAILVLVFAASAQAGLEDRSSLVTLKADPMNYILGPELSADPTLPVADPPSGWWRLYGKANNLYFEDDAGTVTALLPAGATAWDDLAVPDANESLDHTDYYTSWDFGDTDHDMLTLWFTGAFGDVSGMVLEQKTGNPTNGTMLEIKIADTDPDFASFATSGVEKVNISDDGSITLSAGSITVGGNLSVTGSTTLTGTMYQAAVVAAAAGNVNLSIDAAGTGTITIGATSTGKVSTDNAVEMFGAVDIGNAATDTLTITSIIDDDVTLDDSVTDSPALILKDATAETGTFVKVDGSHTTFTPNAADQAFQILTGNLRVGNQAPGTASMNGEDAFIEGELEVDGAVQLDGTVTTAGTLAATTVTVATILTVNEEIAVNFNANDEEIIVTSTAVDYAAGSGIITVYDDGAGQTNASYLLRLAREANGDAQDNFILCQDNSTGAAANGDEMFKVDTGGAVTAAGTITGTGTITGATVQATTLLDVNEDVDVDLNAADEEVSIQNSAEYAADGAQVTINNTDADVGANMYLLRLQYTDDGQTNADFLVCEDNAGDDMLAVNSLGDIIMGGATGTGGKLVTSFEDLTVESGGTAASVVVVASSITTNGDADEDAVTLADGVQGQIKIFSVAVEGAGGDSFKITPTNLNGGSKITFDGTVGDGCIMWFDGTSWNIISNNGGTIS